jgi:hypothetical protein
MSKITPLQVEAFRKLSPEEKNAILEYYPDIYMRIYINCIHHLLITLNFNN